MERRNCVLLSTVTGIDRVFWGAEDRGLPGEGGGRWKGSQMPCALLLRQRVQDVGGGGAGAGRGRTPGLEGRTRAGGRSGGEVPGIVRACLEEGHPNWALEMVEDSDIGGQGFGGAQWEPGPQLSWLYPSILLSLDKKQDLQGLWAVFCTSLPAPHSGAGSRPAWPWLGLGLARSSAPARRGLGESHLSVSQHVGPGKCLFQAQKDCPHVCPRIHV